jgi:hypothetical protein
LLDAAFGGTAFDAGDVGHFALSFNLFDILPQLIFQAFRQAHHPVEHGKEVEDALALPALELDCRVGCASSQ